MKKLLFVFFLMSFAASAAGQQFTRKQCKEEVCRKTPEQKCKQKRGKWRDGVCYITRIRRRTRIKWRTKVKVVKTERVIEKIRVIKIPEKTVIREIEEKRKVRKTTSKKWWWIGPGAFALGLYMTDERIFLSGAEGRLVFAVNNRFRVSGMLGCSFWQEQNLLLGAGLDVRLYKSLFLVTDFNTLWGDFDKLEVKRRYLLVGAGFGWWFGDHADISLRFIFGTKKQVTNCEAPDNFVGGNMLTVNVYF